MAFDLEAIRKKVAQLNGENSKIQLWKPQLGEHKIRILPCPTATAETPFWELMFYYLGDAFPILAPFQFGKPDPINDFIKSLYSTRKREDKDLANKIRPSTRVFVPIIDRANEKDGVLVWGFGKTPHARLLSFIFDPEIGEFMDPTTGFDVKVQIVPNKGGFSKTKIGPIDACRNKSPLHENPEVAKKWLDSIPNIKDLYPIKGEVDLKKALDDYLNGGASEKENDEGTSRGAETIDNVEKLAKDLKEKIEESKTTDESEKKKTRSKKAPDVDEQQDSKYKNLDTVFDSLLKDD